MKNIIIVLSFFFVLTSCKNKKKELVNKITTPKYHQGLSVIGEINLPNNTIIFLQEQLLNKTYKTIKTNKVDNGIFTFTKELNEEKLLFIGFENNDNKIPFIANNFETFINVDIKAIGNAKIKGSELQKEYTIYTDNLEKAKNKFLFKTKYIKNNPNSILSVIILKKMLGVTKWRTEQNRKAYSVLSPKIQNTKIGKNVLEYITKNEKLTAKAVSIAEVSLDPEVTNETPVVEVIKKTTSPSVVKYRKKAPNFYAESIKGNDISLKSILKNNKVVLIDFWASWCAPCRAESPHIKRLYKKYHAKGFDVIGVSEDKYSDMNKWRNAVTNDGLPWHQVIDDNRRVAGMFGVNAIPHTVLVYKNGGIILNKKSSYTIERKLKEIFGY